MINRATRRKNGIAQEENKRVTVYIENNVIILKLVGMVSKVESHINLTPRNSFDLGWSLIKSAWKTWRWKK